jgi:hypothetical protein
MTRTDNEIQSLLADPAVSYWLKGALQAALRRDCLDAARDAQGLATLLDARWAEITGALIHNA